MSLPVTTNPIDDLDVAWRVRASRGEAQCGDAVVVRRDGVRTLFAVLDAHGQGPEAADTIRRAKRFLLGEAVLSRGLGHVIAGLHTALATTRGAAGVLVLRSGVSVQCIGVGDVELRTTVPDLRFVTEPGALGHRLADVHVFESMLRRGDRLVAFTDGIVGRFALADYRTLPTEELCQTLLDHHARTDEDVGLLVADAR
jgi:hypothetical protein